MWTLKQQQQQQPGPLLINARVTQGILGLFGQPELADCQIVFVQERFPPIPTNRLDPYGASSACAAGSGAGQRCGEPLPAHSLILRLASDKLAAQLNWPVASVPIDTNLNKIMAQQLPEVQLMVGGAEELPAARAAIQFAYSGRVEAGSVREALQVRRQAAYLQMEGCMEACVTVVSEQLAAGGGAGAAAAAAGAAGAGGVAAEWPPAPAAVELYSCKDLWPDPAEDAIFAALLKDARRRLVAHFGDALAVLNKQQLYEQMRALPAEGLEALLESDDFGTDSESSVVLVLAEWMAANHGHTDEGTRRRLCGLLRLAQCSRTYLSWVLPALAARHETGPSSAAGWLPLTRNDATCLLTYGTATTVEERRAMIDTVRACGMCAAIQDWPANWLSRQRRRQCLPFEGRAIGFIASLAELPMPSDSLDPDASGRLDLGLVGTRQADHFGAQGLEWNLSVPRHGTAAGVVYVSPRLPAALRAYSAGGAAAAAAVKLLDGAVVAVPRLRVSVCGARRQAWSRECGYDNFVYGWGWPTALTLLAPDYKFGNTASSGPTSLQGGTRFTGSITLLPPRMDGCHF